MTGKQLARCECCGGFTTVEESPAVAARVRELEKALRDAADSLDRAETHIIEHHSSGILQDGLITCPLCETDNLAWITNARRQARAALGKGAVDSAPQSAHTPNKEKT